MPCCSHPAVPILLAYAAVLSCCPHPAGLCCCLVLLSPSCPWHRLGSAPSVHHRRTICSYASRALQPQTISTLTLRWIHATFSSPAPPAARSVSAYRAQRPESALIPLIPTFLLSVARSASAHRARPDRKPQTANPKPQTIPSHLPRLLLFLPSHLFSLLCRTICSYASCAIMPVLLFSRMAIFQCFSYLPTTHLTARCADTPLSPHRARPDRKPQLTPPQTSAPWKAETHTRPRDNGRKPPGGFRRHFKMSRTS